MALLLLAGLQTIPKSLAEAASIDGANAWQYFCYVTPAAAAPTLLIAALFRALDAFRIFDLVYVLTGGGPADSTEIALHPHLQDALLDAAVRATAPRSPPRCS